MISAEALGKLPEQDEGVQERVDARIGKAEARSSLAPGRHRTIDGVQGIFAEDAIVAQTFDLEQPSIGRKADRAQFGEIAQAPADAEVIGVVDGRLRAQGAIFLVAPRLGLETTSGLHQQHRKPRRLGAGRM
jgi:hypothetical protein